MCGKSWIRYIGWKNRGLKSKDMGKGQAGFVFKKKEGKSTMCYGTAVLILRSFTSLMPNPQS